MSLKSRIIQRLFPNNKIYTKKKSGEKCLYLTFDDGPTPRVTPQVLELLSKHETKATFFFIGKRMENHPAIVRQAMAEGHALGNHSYNHKGFKFMPTKHQLAEIIQTNELMSEFNIQKENILFRPPHGRWRISLLWQLIKRNIPVVLWSVDSQDYSKKASQELCQRLLQMPMSDGDIILFHDDNDQCLELLETLIPAWKARGFNFQSLS
ncbi:polysaccharide deacetylase family protein [Thalassotalea litorea]|uniref:Polysaccharide deacetylase family protein n=1 Tax=Thalassotalea litorea TaxID=2020715 RepID=A0A5R9IJN9_9GAMM|nr:polysaccharide deacetylase family protein [Thalassotalea litorea]TLU65770.1 polysaccharide deacetylase family protein [Thalassotalea litorea]